MSQPVIKKLPVSKLAIKDVMVKGVWCLTSDMTVRTAIEMLIQQKISGAPLVHRDTNLLLSVVSEADLIKFAAMDALENPLIMHMDKLPTVSQLITVRSEEAFSELFKKFLVNPVRRVVVVNDNNQVIGLVSRRDVMAAFLK